MTMKTLQLTQFQLTVKHLDVLETALMWFEGQPEADFISTMVSTGFSSFKIKEKYIMK